jgi:hypothetical protein
VRERAREKDLQQRKYIMLHIRLCGICGSRKENEIRKKKNMLSLSDLLLVFVRGCSLELRIIKYTLTLTRLVVICYGGKRRKGRNSDFSRYLRLCLR